MCSLNFLWKFPSLRALFLLCDSEPTCSGFMPLCPPTRKQTTCVYLTAIQLIGGKQQQEIRGAGLQDGSDALRESAHVVLT